MKHKKAPKRPSAARGQRKTEERHTCRFCGHDGGKEEVVKMDSIVGVGGYGCKDLDACSMRIRKRANSALHEPIRRAHAFMR